MPLHVLGDAFLACEQRYDAHHVHAQRLFHLLGGQQARVQDVQGEDQRAASHEAAQYEQREQPLTVGRAGPAGYLRARDNAGVRGLHALGGAGFLEAGQKGFKEGAVGRCFALQRAQLDGLPALGARLRLCAS